MRITFKKVPRETGLAGVIPRPESWEIKIDGIRVGGLSATDLWFRNPKFYFYISCDHKYINTWDSPVDTLEEAKEAAKLWIKSYL